VSKGSSKRQYIDKPLMLLIGAKISETRRAKNKSIHDLAADCDVDYSQIVRMERGEVNFSVSNLSRVAKALKVDIKDLFP
jgi:transcriptional regulator with XRE-family HTH domain